MWHIPVWPYFHLFALSYQLSSQQRLETKVRRILILQGTLNASPNRTSDGGGASCLLTSSVFCSLVSRNISATFHFAPPSQGEEEGRNLCPMSVPMCWQDGGNQQLLSSQASSPPSPTSCKNTNSRKTEETTIPDAFFPKIFFLGNEGKLT